MSRNRFTAPEELEDELRARTAVLDVFNRTREDFADPAAYAAYADHVEDLIFRLVWERDREGVNAELEAERAQHSAEISMRASQHIVQANALEHRAREEDMAAQRGLHELYATVADINAQEEGLPPAAKAREPAPSTKVPVKRPRESSAAASPAPALAPVPAPAVSPAVQAPLQQRAPVAPTPAPDLHIDDDSSFSTQEKHAAAGFSMEPLARRATYETYASLCYMR